MAIINNLTGSRSITFVAIFAAMVAVLDSIPMLPAFYVGIYDSWGFMLSPLIGILLGPIYGAVSVLIGGFVGHVVFPRPDVMELLYMLGGPIGAGIAGLAYQQKWKPVFSIYSLMLVGYFLTPVTWSLSLLGIWDVLVGFGILLFVTLLANINKANRFLNSSYIRLVLGSVIGLEADILVRIFILIPGQMWWAYYGIPLEALQLLWLTAGIVTPIKVAVATIATVGIGKALLSHFKGQSLESDNQLVME